MATDKLVEIDHVKDYISREAAIALTDQHCFETSYDAVWMEEELRKLSSADVVARDCYDRILAENDTMRNQLAKVGKKVGDSMDDVRPVVRGNENRTSPIKDSYICSVCVEKTLSGFCWNPAKTNFCPNCGADMSENKNGQIGEKNSG